MNNDILDLSKRLELTPKTFEKPKQLYYNGILTDKLVKCDLVGIESENPLIVVIEFNGIKQKIDVDYLKEMQPTKAEIEKNGL